MGRKTKMNSITSHELIAQISSENIQLLNDFKDYCKSTQKSEGTIAGYESDILISFVWNLQNNQNKFFVDWTKRNIMALQNWLIGENENSPARVRRIKASLSSMSNFIENVLDDEYPNFRNIIHKIESPVNAPVREKTVFEDSELEDLLEDLVESNQHDKACFLALAMYGGRRKAELCRFKVSDFDDDKLVCDGALYKSAPIKTKGRGVNGKMLECYTLAKKFNPYLNNWMKMREENGIDSEWLFPARGDMKNHMSISTVNSWANTFSRMTGKDFYWHSIRHYQISALSRAGIPDSIIVEMTGWKNSEMFKIYNDNPKDNQIARYFKNGDIAVPDQKSFSDI